MTFFRLCFRQSLHRLPFFILASCYAFCVGIIMAHRDTLPSDPSFLLDYLEQLPYGSDSDGEPTPSPCNSHLLDKMLKPLYISY